MIKLGIIGLGHMGGYHLSASKLLQHAHVVAVADKNEKNLRKTQNPQIIKSHDYNEWIDQIDAVIIAIPTNLHYQVAKDCLLKGKHVLLEKPITKNLKEATELFEIAQTQNKALHIGHVERFNGAIQELKKIMKNPFLIESHRIGPFAKRVQQDSVIIDLMIHDLDLIINLIDSPVKNINVLANKVKTDLSDLAIVQLLFENGTMANIVSSRISQTKQRSMLIHQLNEFIKLDFTTQDISIHKNPSDSVKIGKNELSYKQESTIERLFVYKDNPLKLEIENFVNAAITRKNLFDAKKDLEALRVTLKIEELVRKQFHDSNNIRHRQLTPTSMQNSHQFQ
jgi:predicted dehydrogenase